MRRVLLLALLLCAGTAVAENPVEWAARDYKQNGRPIVLLLGAPWCHFCIEMKNGTMSRLSADGVLGNVNYQEIDTDTYPDVKKRYARGGAQGMIPQLIFLQKGEKGWTKAILVGKHDAEQVKQFLVKHDHGKLKEFIQQKE